MLPNTFSIDNVLQPSWTSCCVKAWQVEIYSYNPILLLITFVFHNTLNCLLSNYKKLVFRLDFPHFLTEHLRLFNALIFLSLEIQINEHTNYDRLTSFLGCNREVLGSSSVLCLSFRLYGPEEDDVDSPLGLMARLSQKGINKYIKNLDIGDNTSHKYTLS